MQLAWNDGFMESREVIMTDFDTKYKEIDFV